MAGSGSLLASIRGALASGDVAQALALIRQAESADLSSRERAELLRARAQLAFAGVSPAGLGSYPDIVREAEQLAGDEPVIVAFTLADAAGIALYRFEVDEAMRLLGRARQCAGDDVAAGKYVTAVTGIAETFRGDLDTATSLLVEAIDPFAGADSVGETAQLLQSAVVSLAAVEKYDKALAICQRGVAAARRVGAVGIMPWLLCLLANTAYFTGDYDTVVLAGGEAHDLATGTEQPGMVVFAASCLALAHAVRGNAPEVDRHLARSRELIDAAGMHAFRATNLVAEGLLALGDEDFAHAAAVYSALDTSLEQSQRVGVLQWQADHVESLLRAGFRDRAHTAYATFDRALGQLPLGWSQTVAARCRGLLAVDGWREHFAAAVARHPRWMSPFELGRTHLCWAERALASGDDAEAREHAAEAARCFADAVAQPWLRRAEALLAQAADSGGAGKPAAQVTSAALELRAFGPLTLTAGGVEELVRMDAPGRLLRYLVALGGRTTVDAAVEVLWPESPPGAGATRLRNVLSRMRRRWGDVVVRDGGLLRLGADVSVDVVAFEAEAEAALGRRDVALAQVAVRRYRGEPLPAVRNEDWSVVLRERTRRSYVRLLHMLADDAVDRGEVDRALSLMEQAIATDQYDDGHYLHAARLLVAAGRPGAARRYLERAQAVAEELGVEPSQQFHEISAAILRTS